MLNHCENTNIYNFIIENSTYYMPFDKNEDYEELLCSIYEKDIQNVYINFVSIAIKLNSRKLYKTILDNLEDNIIQENQIDLIFKMQHFNFLDLLVLGDTKHYVNNLFEKLVDNNMIDNLICLLITGNVDIKLINNYINKQNLFYKNPIIMLTLFQHIYINSSNIYILIDYLIFSYTLCKSYNIYEYEYSYGYEYNNYKIYKYLIRIKDDIKLYNILSQLLKKISNDISICCIFVKYIIDMGFNINFTKYALCKLCFFSNSNIIKIFDILDDSINIFNKHKIHNIYYAIIIDISKFNNFKIIFSKYYKLYNDEIMLMLIKNPIFLKIKNYINKIYNNQIRFPLCYDEIKNNYKNNDNIKNNLK